MIFFLKWAREQSSEVVKVVSFSPPAVVVSLPVFVCHAVFWPSPGYINHGSQLRWLSYQPVSLVG